MAKKDILLSEYVAQMTFRKHCPEGRRYREDSNVLEFWI